MYIIILLIYIKYIKFVSNLNAFRLKLQVFRSLHYLMFSKYFKCIRIFNNFEHFASKCTEDG